MRSGNPALNSKTFAVNAQADEKMTLGGTVNKTAILLALVLITAAWELCFNVGRFSARLASR